MLEKINKKLTCEKHNSPLKIMSTSDVFCVYVCEDCKMEEYI